MTISIFILFLTHILIPLVSFFWIWMGKDQGKLDWLIKILTVGSFLLYLFLAGRWDWVSYYLRFIYLVLFVFLVWMTYRKVRVLPFIHEKALKSWMATTVNCLLLVLFIVAAAYVLTGYYHPVEPVQLAFPLKQGTYYIAHGGSKFIVNAHNPSRLQRYALDINKLNSFGSRAYGLYPTDLRKYQVFGDTVYSPCTGRIVAMMDSLPDLIPPEMDRKNPAGNYVAIDCNGVKVFLAHFLHRSIKVQKGDSVVQGQSIGQVGNSGNTSEPHLHIHAEKADTGDSVLVGSGIPILFDGRFLVRNSLVVQ